MDMSKTLSDLPMDLHCLILSHDEEKIQLKKDNEKLKTRVKMLQCLLDEARQDSDSDEDTDDEDVILGHKKCWTCVKNKATHKVWRDALDEYEYTCDVCHKNEYPEDYEDEDTEDNE